MVPCGQIYKISKVQGTNLAFSRHPPLLSPTSSTNSYLSVRDLTIMTGGDEDGELVHQKRQSRRSDEADDEGGDVVVYSPPKKKAHRVASPSKNAGSVQKFVLILVGIPGSGKSTFASRLVEVSAPFFLFVI